MPEENTQDILAQYKIKILQISNLAAICHIIKHQNGDGLGILFEKTKTALRDKRCDGTPREEDNQADQETHGGTNLSRRLRT